MDQFTNTPDTTAAYTQEDISSNKGMAILAYLSWLVLIPLFAAKNSPFAKYHTSQGFTLWLAGIVWNVVSWLLSKVFSLIPFLGGILNLLLGLISFAIGIAILVLAIIGIVNAAKGLARELPFIGGIKILK